MHLYEGVIPPLIPILLTEFNTDYFHLYAPLAANFGNFDAFTGIQDTNIVKSYNLDYQLTNAAGPYRNFVWDSNQINSNPLTLDKIQSTLHSNGHFTGHWIFFSDSLYDLDLEQDNWLNPEKKP